MADINPPTQVKGVKSRYLTALLIILVVIIAVSFLDQFIKFAIDQWYPQYSSYTIYLAEGFNTMLGLITVYAVYRILLSILARYRLHRPEVGSNDVPKLILKILLYIAVITIALIEFGPILGVSISQALAGGAIGGIIIGLAVQTIVSAILSGFLISSSKTLRPGDIVVLQSNYFKDILCKVIAVTTLFAEVRTCHGNRIRVPNTLLLSYTTFTNLKSGDGYSYPFQITFNADVPLKNFKERVDVLLKEEFAKAKLKPPTVYLNSKGAALNTYNVILYFDDFDRINQLIDIVNTSFDDVYWSCKEPAKPSKPKSAKK